MKTLHFRVILPALLLCAPLLLRAETVKTIAEREAARRQARIPQGEDLAARGQTELEAHQFAQAHEDFRRALNYIPAGNGAYQSALDGFCKSGVSLAEQRAAEGKYNEAEQVLNELVSDRYNPSCREARTMLVQLHEPGRINKTMGPQFLAKVEQVKQWLTEAEGFYQSGRYDLAMKRYDQVLKLDPYNSAARKGQERIDQTKFQYGKQAYNETRGRAIWQVEKGWEEPVRQYGLNVGPIADAVQREATGTARITHKLDTIIIPRIEFRDASVRETLEFIRQQAAANDPATEGRRGVDIILRDKRFSAGVEVEAGLPSNATTLPPVPEGSPSPPPTATPAGLTKRVSNQLNLEQARITLALNDIPLGEALRYIAAQAGLRVKVEPYAVVVLPLNQGTDELIKKTYHVPPEFFGGPLDIGAYYGSAAAASTGQQNANTQTAPPLVAGKISETDRLNLPTTIQRNSNYTSNDVGLGGNSAASNATTQISGGGQADVKLRQQLVNDRQLVGRATAQEHLESMGVSFPLFTDGTRASATFLPQSGTLVVRNTKDNLDMIDELVEQANGSRPKQVEIESKFVEITQNNLKELGFDWLLGPFNIGNHKIFGSGGTTGTGQTGQFPIVDQNGVPIGQLPVTAGNRSGNFAISATALDALVAGTGGVAAAAPGIFGLSGVFTDPQFQVVIRALNQKKGVDLLSAPKVTTKSGQRAVIEIVREFRYPTQFTAPQVPNISGGTGGGTVAITAVTPTTPTAFDTRNTGVTLEVDPIVGTDGTIDLNLVPQVVEFEGFINYGSPIFGINPSLISATVVPQVLLTNNVINQPIFSTRKVNTSVSMYDGATVVLGGLMREDVQKTEDRTPIIGDIPLVGRLFRTNAEQHTKRNLIIFVTAHIVTPGGEMANVVDEEETVTPPELPEVPMYKK